MTDLFHKYFRGETSTREEQRIMDYVASSPDAKRKFRHEHQLYDACILHGGLQEHHSPRRYRMNPAYLLRIAAVWALVATIGWAVSSLGGEDKTLAAMQTITVPRGSHTKISLPDGSTAFLNSGSQLSCPLDFGKKERRVQLSGEGYFEVNRQTTPFIVQTDKGHKVEALGTTFDVSAYSESDFTAILINGSVKVSLAGRTGAVVLHPEEYLEYDGNQPVTGHVTDMDRLLWRKGILYFDDVPFADMMRTLEQCYGITIKIQTKKDITYRCTGKFRQAEGIDHIFHVLQYDLRFKYSRLEDQQTILITL